MKRVLLVLLLATMAWGLDVSKLQPRGYVSDFAGVLDAGSLAAIEAYCGNVERATGAQFAIVTVPSLEDDTVEEAAVRLFEAWKIGKAKTDEGVLLLLAVKDRKNRIEVGYGLEPVIPDGAAGGILRQIRPLLQTGDYGGALMTAAQLLGQRVAEAKGVTIEGQQQRPVRRNEGDGIGGFVLSLALFIIIMSLFGGGRRRGGGGGAGNVLTAVLLSQMLGGGRRHGGGWSGGGFGGSGGGWSGGGGFGGFGGGRSGGGGASGGW
jgi:uncharacterized protein